MRTANRRARVVALVAAALLPLVLAGCGITDLLKNDKEERVVHGDYRIERFSVKVDGSLGGLIAEFGKPSGLWHNRFGCQARWWMLGLQVSLYNLNGKDPCSEEGGRFATAVMTGSGWETSKGLKIGDSYAKAKTLFPKSRYLPPNGRAWLWLIHRHVFPISEGTYGAFDYSGLSVKILGDRVVALRLRYPAGGF